MSPKTIFLDLDDVLNSFTMSALKEAGCPVGVHEYEKYNPAWKYNIIGAANVLHPDRTFSENEFWKSLGPSFWATIPISIECGWLVRRCEALVGREQICVLTTPTQDTYVAAAKMEWIHFFLPGWLHQQFLIGPCKHLCARPDALLIDDSQRNVKKFITHGGQAILFPRPWNSLWQVPPKVHLHHALERCFNTRNYSLVTQTK